MWTHAHAAWSVCCRHWWFEGYGVFVGHLDRFNPQWKTFQDQQPVTLIFHGPETYISPSVYHSTQLPTWNYFKARRPGVAKGTCFFSDSDPDVWENRSF